MVWRLLGQLRVRCERHARGEVLGVASGGESMRSHSTSPVRSPRLFASFCMSIFDLQKFLGN